MLYYATYNIILDPSLPNAKIQLLIYENPIDIS